MRITILRLGHRIFRDQRITTHVFLAGRALGARDGFYTGQRDREMEESVARVGQQFGGGFRVRHIESEKVLFRRQGQQVAHLTVYGLPFQGKLPEIRKARRLLVVVGGEKVAPHVYQEADWNVAVTGQPHSEVAALGVFLYALRDGKAPERFPQARLRIVKQERGKKIVSKG